MENEKDLMVIIKEAERRGYEKGIMTARLGLKNKEVQAFQKGVKSGRYSQKNNDIILSKYINDFLEYKFDFYNGVYFNARDLYSEFVQYLQERGIDFPPTECLFGRCVSTKLWKSKSNGKMVYHGIKKKDGH